MKILLITSGMLALALGAIWGNISAREYSLLLGSTIISETMAICCFVVLIAKFSDRQSAWRWLYVGFTLMSALVLLDALRRVFNQL